MSRTSKVVPLLYSKPEVSEDLQEWYNYFFSSKTPKMDIQFRLVKRYMRNYYGFLQENQINGRCYDFLKIPNTMGTINKSKFLKKIKEKLKKERKDNIEMLNSQVMNLGHLGHCGTNDSTVEYENNRFFKRSRFERMVDRSQFDLYWANKVILDSSINVKDEELDENEQMDSESIIESDYNDWAPRNFLRSESSEISGPHECESPPRLLQPSSLESDHQIALGKIKMVMSTLKIQSSDEEGSQSSTFGEAPMSFCSSINIDDEFDANEIDTESIIESDYNDWARRNFLRSESSEISGPRECESPPRLLQPSSLGSDHQTALGKIKMEMSTLKIESSDTECQNEEGSQSSTFGEAQGLQSEHSQSGTNDSTVEYEENRFFKFERIASMVDRSQFDLYWSNNIILDSSINVKDEEFDENDQMDSDRIISETDNNSRIISENDQQSNGNNEIINESDGNNGVISENDQESTENYRSSSPDGILSWNCDISQWYFN